MTSKGTPPLHSLRSEAAPEVESGQFKTAMEKYRVCVQRTEWVEVEVITKSIEKAVEMAVEEMKKNPPQHTNKTVWEASDVIVRPEHIRGWWWNPQVPFWKRSKDYPRA